MVAERGAVFQCVGCKSVSFVEKEGMAVEGRNRMMMAAKNSVNSWARGSLIGQGAFGKVNLALNRESGELFAVKSIEWGAEKSNMMMSGEMTAMETEVGILESLKESPFVVNCLGSSISVEDGKTMRNLFMEYMPGGSVADLMRKFGGAGFEEPLLRKYTRGVLEGIRFLHAEGIVHCDIKGRNVLVGSTGVVKLADFGGARRFLGLEMVGEGGAGGEVVGLTVDSDLLNVKGTPLWMAPEVVRQKEQGPASDIWSLGCTVVEMATGKAPWSDIVGSDPFVALYHIGCTEEVPTVPARLSEQARDFLSKCFQRDPRVRWTASQLLQHPFITDAFATQSNEPAELTTTATKRADPLQPESPTSAFDFPSSSSSNSNTASAAALTASTTIVNSVPILRSPLHFFAKRFPQQQQQQEQQVCSVFQTEDPASPSVPSTPSTLSPWCNSPLSDFGGQWITVRTPTKTVSSAPSLPSPIAPSAAATTAPAAGGAESAPVKVAEEITAPVASCGTPTEGEGAEPQQNDESPEVETPSRATPSSAIPHQAPSSFNRSSDQNVDEVDTVLSSNNSELGCGPSAPAAAVVADDERGFIIDPRGMMAAPISGPSRATFRSFLQKGSAHRKLSCKGRKRRPKPRLKRFRGCKGLHGLLHRRQPWSRRRVCSNDRFLVRRRRRSVLSAGLQRPPAPPSFITHRRKLITISGRRSHNYSFRERVLLSLRRISTDSFASALLRGAIILQSLFFRNRYGWNFQPFFKDRLFLNKRASPQWPLQSTQQMTRASM